MKPNRIPLLISAVFLGVAMMWAGPAAAQYSHGQQNTQQYDGDGGECDRSDPTVDCGVRCCVRERKKVKAKVNGRWRVRTVLGGWRCFTGPEAVEKCRRLRRR